MTSYCGSKHPYVSEVFCERPGEGLRANHPEHTGWAGGESLGAVNGAVSYVGYWVDWPNAEYVSSPRPARVVRTRGENSLRYRQTIHQIAQRTRGGRDEKAN